MPGGLVVSGLESYDFQETGRINHYGTASEHEAKEQEAGEEWTGVRQDLGKLQRQAWEPLHSTLLVQPHSLPFPFLKGNANNRKRTPDLGLLVW